MNLMIFISKYLRIRVMTAVTVICSPNNSLSEYHYFINLLKQFFEPANNNCLLCKICINTYLGKSLNQSSYFNLPDPVSLVSFLLFSRILHQIHDCPSLLVDAVNRITNNTEFKIHWLFFPLLSLNYLLL